MSRLREDNGSTNKGAFRRAVRRVPNAEHDLILAAGFTHVLGRQDRELLAPDPIEEARIGFSDNPQMPYEVDTIDRLIIPLLTLRHFSDRAFQWRSSPPIMTPTGLKLINGGERSEVQAARICPVAHGGLDSVRIRSFYNTTATRSSRGKDTLHAGLGCLSCNQMMTREYIPFTGRPMVK